MSYSVYVLKDNNGKIYVGTTSLSLTARWNNGNGYRFVPELWEMIQSEGWSSIEKSVIATGLSREIASKMEQELIAQYDSTNPEKGYNREKGGLNRDKLITDATRTKMSIATTGERNHNYGKHFSKEHRAKLSNSNKGQKRSKEICRNIGLSKQKGVAQYTTNGCLIAVYESGKQASEITGVDASHIGHVCSRKRATAGGYRWEYV